MIKVLVNDYEIKAKRFEANTISKQGKPYRKITMTFDVSSQEYHTVTTLLYKNDFEVKVPSKELQFRAEIFNYSTDVTNLYKPGNIGDYYLELIERI